MAEILGPVARIVRSLDSLELKFEEVVGDAGWAMPWHEHPSTYLDLYLIGGAEASWSSILTPHTVSVLPSGVRHRATSIAPFRTFQVVIADSWFSRSGLGNGWRPALSVFDASLPAQIANKMFRRFRQPDDLVLGDLEELLLDFWAATINRLQLGAPVREAKWLRDAEDLLASRFAESPTPSEIAREIGIHSCHLMREFRRRHRCTMGDYVRAKRIERACQLLRDGQRTLAEVAHEVGFFDQSHFVRSFKTQLGVTPGEFVKQDLREPDCPTCIN